MAICDSLISPRALHHEARSQVSVIDLATLVVFGPTRPLCMQSRIIEVETSISLEETSVHAA
jgi:hypothetical protein